MYHHRCSTACIGVLINAPEICRNEMIICDGRNCGVVVHIGCYGLSAVPEDEFWFCDGCQDKLNPLESNCILCPVTGGVLREVCLGYIDSLWGLCE